MSLLGKRLRLGKALLRQISLERNIDIPSIVGRYNYDYLVEVRREYCVRARELGLGTPMIGKILERDHATVMYHLNPEMRRIKSDRSKERRAAL